MQWKKKHKCGVCGTVSNQGEKIHGRFMCRTCEEDMVTALAKEHEDRELAEVNRISNMERNNGGYHIG